jgi:hypothetical protein
MGMGFQSILFPYRQWMTVLLLAVGHTAFGQLVEMPIRPVRAYPEPSHSTATARITAVDPLPLPFFDDLARSSQVRFGTHPDSMRWMPGSGVNINNNQPINHPTYNVATFDGLKANGTPYDFSSPLIQGATDTLTSRPIDLSIYQPADSIYLSFFWEARGLAEQPDLNDSITLEFRDNLDRWHRVWVQRGQRVNPETGSVENVSNTEFVQVLVPVNEVAYFHAGFQFRFQAFGRLAGAYDVWHLDYIYMDRGRNLNTPYPGRPGPSERYPKDIAARQSVSSFLKTYTAMPAHQYLSNPATETAESITTDINNLFNTPTFTTFRVRVEDTLSKQVFQSCDLPPQQIQAPCNATPEGINSLAAQIKSFVPYSLPATTVERPMVLRTTFDFNITGEFTPEVDVTENNRISGYTTLSDYFAYDDGTAEAAAGVNQRTGGAAVQFAVNQPDTLRAVRIHIAQANVNLEAQTFVLQIYGHKNGKPDEVPLYQKDTLIHYSKVMNGFVEYPLIPTPVVRDTFYVAWQQTSETPLPIGLDKNTNSQDRIFINLGTNIQGRRDWSANADQEVPVTGSLMIRPVVGPFQAQVTGVEEPSQPIPALEVYPNPTNGIVHWNDDRFSKVRLYDLSGRLLLTQDTKGQSAPQLDVSALSNGLYLLHLSNGTRTVVRKVIVSH